MENFYNEHEADLAIISTPPFLHCKQSVYALSKGSYVLCEKPIAPTVEDAEAMIEAEKKIRTVDSHRLPMVIFKCYTEPQKRRSFGHTW